MVLKDVRPDQNTGLCLGGGGGLGLLHLGLFNALEDLRIRPGVIAGTSSGAIMGAFFAAGFSSVEITHMTRGFNWWRVVAPAIPIRGYISTRRLEGFFRRHLGDRDIAELPLKLGIAAMDLHSGELKVFREGSLAKCLAASCAVPGIFEPVEIHGRHYYDAGGVYNLPLELFTERRPELIIAANTIGEQSLMADPRTAREIIYQAYLIRCRLLAKWRLDSMDWEGKNEKSKVILIDYESDGVNPGKLEGSGSMVLNVYNQSMKILQEKFRK